MARSRGRLQGPARVLVVADEPVASFVAQTLNHGLYTVETTSDVGAAQNKIETWKPHLLVLCVDVRSGDPRPLIAARVRARRTPTIVVTKRGDLKTKLDAFEKGADDFVTVPISPEELVARALALMRRAYGDAVPFKAVVTIGALQIDLLNQRVHSGSARVDLTTMEQALLYLLASNANTTLARDAILDALWGSDFVASSNLVDRHIRNLRVKLKDDWRNPRLIRTVPGKGYRFLAAGMANSGCE